MPPERRHAGDFRDPSKRNHYVYRLYSQEGDLLYIGCTIDLWKRWRGHRSDNREMIERVTRARMQGPFNYDTARAMERAALRAENPAYGRTPYRPAAEARLQGRAIWRGRRG